MEEMNSRHLDEIELLFGVGDLHGHYPALNSLLVAMDGYYNIFEDDNPAKLKPDTAIVFMGDYIDRGNQALKIIEMVKAMKKENPNSVEALFGNHELLALADLDAAKQAARSGDPFHHYLCYSNHSRRGGDAFVREFEGDTPQAVFDSYAQRMSRNGDIGQWMRGLSPFWLPRANGKTVLFVHAGIPENLNSRHELKDYLDRFDSHMAKQTQSVGGSEEKYLESRLVDTDSIFWDRRIPQGMTEAEVHALADSVRADYVVIGHTPQRTGRIANYYNRVFDIDVGMTPRYGGNEPAAIVFKPGGVFAFYAKRGEEKLI